MSDPIRLLDDDGVTPRERDVLRAARAQGLTAAEVGTLWTAIAGAVAIPTGAAAAAGGAAAGSAATGAGGAATGAAVAATSAAPTLASTVAVKGALVALTLGVAAVTAVRIWQPSEPPLPAPTSPAVQAAPLDTYVPPAVVPPPQPAPAPRPPARPPRAEASRPFSPSRLAAESRVVLEAQRALRAGDPAAALRRLDEARDTFADGALVQEREALAIEALARAGQGEAARARAAAFLRAYPQSPHAANVKKLGAR